LTIRIYRKISTRSLPDENQAHNDDRNDEDNYSSTF
jgi:hypothetical protein